MSHFTKDTILVIEKILTKDIVNIVDEVMLENNFTLAHSSSFFHFEDTDPESDVDDSKTILIETLEEALKMFEEFKGHPTGGSYSYNMHWGYNEHGQKLGYEILVAFLSFDNKNIEAVILYVSDDIFEKAYEKELKKVFAEINKRTKVIAATQTTDYYQADYHEIDIIEEILSGNIPAKYEYKFTE
ncbi:hypothetical protein DRF65_10360 [Chryseobacterium pennae]|uniref:Uncharacterized protein n=1 Tax=Chryseobacterium pennae TaxID=2258962 RepID=A0A3D9CA74_9FLAO|nr:hypothetical protein [Chryseobacterium pennae]REC62486.1 hypothetical protein DRF65_10360 [Chryseobacterium pennae]